MDGIDHPFFNPTWTTNIIHHIIINSTKCPATFLLNSWVSTMCKTAEVRSPVVCQVIKVSSIAGVGNTVHDVRDGNIGQDRTPLEVHSLVARRAINVTSIDGVPTACRAIDVSAVACSINDV